ncbi:hypothetical protein Tcan_14823 [Toxocara canis]|uniref:Uncharacterized protein n=1 Tax=Toxocara canis TaxID=6265 RepID=A0A0B2VY60_TOXCA|nr:hypothetical protein Tcan_14823 [Toxocara canis]
MLQWISEVASPRNTRAIEKRPLPDDGDRMMIDLIIAEVESAVSRFETEQEIRRSERCLREHVADYSWLATNSSARRRKYLSMSERSKIESACCLIIASEWSALLSTWRSRMRMVSEREHILEAFSSAVHEVIASRPRSNTLTDVLLNYIRHRPSLNSVGNDTPRSDTAELTAINPRFPLDDFTHIV